MEVHDKTYGIKIEITTKKFVSYLLFSFLILQIIQLSK